VILGLNASTAYKLVPEKNNLRVVFTKKTAPAPGAASRPGPAAPMQEPPSPAAQPAPGLGVLKGVNVVPRGGGVAVYMRVDGKVDNYKTFTIDDPLPARIVVDLMGIRSAFDDEQKIPVKGNIVKRVRHLGYPDKVCVVVETEKGYLTDFSLKPVENGMALQVGGSTRKEN
jgi:AMIN domain